MAATDFNDPKTDHSSCIQWMDENLDRAKEICREAGRNLNILTREAFALASREIRFLVSRLTAFDFICGGLTLMVMFVAGLFLLSGFGLVGYQLFLWLKDGVWSEFPIVIVFNFLFENTGLHQWLVHPESWFGLQKVVEWLLENIPLSLALIVPAAATIGAMICLFFTALTIRFYQFKKTEKS